MPGEDERTATRTLPPSDVAHDATLPSPGGTPTPSVGTGDDDDLEALPPGTRLGRYEVGAVLGSGGMGVVYGARDPELDRALAIKVLRPHGASARAQARLLNEARAMAKLRHPNVVPVFDVGAAARGVYVVMPLFAGGTLHDWLGAAPRPWGEVLDRFVAAGHGLAAAHDAGLIHRDFKPRNVMVGDAGEVLVGDFGIAAHGDSTERSGSGGSGAAAAAPPVQVTSIAGTPAYMAPEQARGDTLDARADQYSFCVSLWEGVFGARPAIVDGTAPAPPAAPTDRRGAPPWLVDVLRRGLQPDAARRWPSMRALLAEIDRRRRRPRRLALLAGAVALVGGAATVAVLATGGDHARAPCVRAAAPLDAVWTPARRTTLGAALGGVAHPGARATADHVLAALDATATRWRAARTGTCRATWTAHTQSQELLDLRMSCLDGQLASLDALVRALGDAPDRDTIDHAAAAVASLPDVHLCDDERALRQAYPPPTEPAARATLAALAPRLAEVGALVDLGRGTRGLALSTPLLAEARAVAYPPLLANALHDHGILQRLEGHQEDAIATLREAVQVAATAHDDGRAQELWLELMYTLTSAGHADDALAAVEPARAAVARAGDLPIMRARLLTNQGSALEHVARHDEAQARFDEAVALLRPLGAAAERDLVVAVSNLAGVRGLRGDRAGALAGHAEAVALAERVYGHEHALTLVALNGQAAEQQRQGDLASARTTVEDALARSEAAHGADHPSTANIRGRLAIILLNLDLIDAALPHADRALTVLEHSDDVTSTHALLHNLCSHLIDATQLARAVPMCERAAAAARRIGPKHPYVALENVQIGDALVALHRFADAAPHYREALTIAEAALGAEHLFALMAKNGLARTLLEDGHGTEAIAIMQEVLAVLAKGGADPSFTPQGQFTLAGARWAAGQHAAARADARAAIAGLHALGAPPQATAELEAWLRAHPR